MDPIDPYGDHKSDFAEQRSTLKRVPLVVALLRQLDRVNDALTRNSDAANAIHALYTTAKPYLVHVKDWGKRWADRPCAGILIDGAWVSTPTPQDYAAWYELIIDGLTESGVLFDRVTVNYVGDRPTITNHAKP